MNIAADQKFFIWDAESVGLHGQAFAVAGGVYDINGRAEREFAYHTSTDLASAVFGREDEDRHWIDQNVTIREVSNLMISVRRLRLEFWKEWADAKADYPGVLMFVECGWPVEARFLLACIEDDCPERNWDGPYPMHEIATLMLAAGMDPMATYDRRFAELPAHEPLADSRLSARLLAMAIGRLQQVHEYSGRYHDLCK